MACNNADDESPVDREKGESLHLVEFDPETESVTATIVAAVADLEGTSQTALDPFYNTVDPDALETLIHSVATQPDPSNAEITVRYHGYTITIQSYSVVEIALRDED